MTTQKKTAAALAIAVAIAAPFEGLRNWAYRDPVGIPTICFGSTKGVRMGDYKTTAECKALLTHEMQEFVETVDRCAPGLPPNALAAFSSAAFNVGPALTCGDTTAARLLRQGRWREACDQLPRWNKARVAGQLVELPGLTKRRAAERELCLS